MLLAGELKMFHVEHFAEVLGKIHRAGWEDRQALSKAFADRSFFESLRVEPYYLYTSTQVPETFGFFRELVRDTRSRLFTLVHGDYSPKNVLIRDDQLILLDHEVIHFGDPAFDIGFSMTHFLSKGHHLPAHRAPFLEAAKVYWRTYRQTLGKVLWERDLEDFAIRHTLACMLARVAGRSPLEYLTPGQRAWQRAAVVQMIGDLPASMDQLIETFLERE
jgi:aminoglycoside phosphotransferase (APT) family kinase protein